LGAGRRPVAAAAVRSGEEELDPVASIICRIIIDYILVPSFLNFFNPEFPRAVIIMESLLQW
jgi:hypothetical protein